MIWKELNKKLIMTDLDAKNYDEVMEKLGGLLIKEGYCKETYVDALKEREAEYPTGLDIEGVGVAIPHTPVTHVLRHAIAIARLQNPVEFIQMGSEDETTNVKIVFMLAVDDPNAHIDQLQEILKIIQDKKVLMELAETKDADEINNIIKEKEKENN